MEFALSSSMAALQLYPKYLHIPANARNNRRATAGLVGVYPYGAAV